MGSFPYGGTGNPWAVKTTIKIMGFSPIPRRKKTLRLVSNGGYIKESIVFFGGWNPREMVLPWKIHHFSRCLLG